MIWSNDFAGISHRRDGCPRVGADHLVGVYSDGAVGCVLDGEVRQRALRRARGHGAADIESGAVTSAAESVRRNRAVPTDVALSVGTDGRHGVDAPVVEDNDDRLVERPWNVQIEL